MIKKKKSVGQDEKKKRLRETSGLVERLEMCENVMLGSNNVFLTASLVTRLSLGVSSD